MAARRMLQVADWREVRRKLGLPINGRGASALERIAAAQSVTAAELAAFVRMCAARYERKRMEPGARPGVGITPCCPCRSSLVSALERAQQSANVSAPEGAQQHPACLPGQSLLF